MIIGIAGAKRSGKNTAAQFIKEEFGELYQVKEWSFAEDLKKSAAAALGVEENAIEWCDGFKEWGDLAILDNGKEIGRITGRSYLQWYGTEAHRNVFGDDFWVENLMQKILWDDSSGFSWEERLDVITDVRFPNEAETISFQGGYILRICREEVENAGDTHASEIPLPAHLVNYEVHNNGTLDQFSQAVSKAIYAFKASEAQ